MSKEHDEARKADPSPLDQFLTSKYEARDGLESTKQFIAAFRESAVGGLATVADRSREWVQQQVRSGLDEFVSRIFGLSETSPRAAADKEPDRDDGRDR